MHLQGLTVALRQRTPWEAADLGIALVRRHARRIWSCWFAVTLPVAVLVSLIGWAVDAIWLGSLLLWWLKPVFDRIPLYILSRAVFGEMPSAAETLRAQRHWGWQGIWPWLLWRRFNTARCVLLPVDLLEGLVGQRRTERSRVLTRAGSAPTFVLTMACMHMEAVLSVACVVSLMLFVPVEFLSESAQAMFQTLYVTPPPWAQFLANFTYWAALSLIEPFYVGAGFGIYLNRRTQLEAWDVELAFRALAQRLAQPLALVLLLAGLGLQLPAQALPSAAVVPLAAAVLADADSTDDSEEYGDEEVEDDAEEDSADDSADRPDGAYRDGERVDDGLAVTPAPTPAHSLRSIFTREPDASTDAFEAAVQKSFEDPLLKPTQTVKTWRLRNSPSVPDAVTPPSPMPLVEGLAALMQVGMWLLMGGLLLLLARYWRYWMPWVTRPAARKRTLDALDEQAIALPETLPDDLPAAVRGLWQQSKRRAALALLYRAAVARLADTLGAPLPPGSTESQCLRYARNLADPAYAGLFTRIVRHWQGAAYADRFPGDEELERMLLAWAAVPGKPA